MVKRIAVTGSSGHIAYNLLFRIAHGDLFGEEKIDLRLYDLPEQKEMLEGVAMELVDSAFPLLHKLTLSHDLSQSFDGADLVLLLGAKPRTKGMERIDLLQENGKIFVQVGRALNEAAHEKTKVIVVGNPCNTNCLIALHHAPKVPRSQFHAMMRLDQNRARALLAQKAGCSISEVKKLSIWGNHSPSQVADYHLAEIKGRPASEFIDMKWLQNDFMTSVQKRGSEILAKRGSSSAASAASSLIDAVCALYQPTDEGDWHCSAICSDGNPYGIEENLVFGFPLRTEREGLPRIVEGLQWDFFIKEKIALTQKELLDERACIKELLRR